MTSLGSVRNTEELSKQWARRTVWIMSSPISYEMLFISGSVRFKARVFFNTSPSDLKSYLMHQIGLLLLICLIDSFAAVSLTGPFSLLFRDTRNNAKINIYFHLGSRYNEAYPFGKFRYDQSTFEQNFSMLIDNSNNKFYQNIFVRPAH
jgi:hypothetical protein